ncbi:MAG: hypothetical protein NWQ54_04775 [Paraglaciecola sp.]|nr:hypothetical protein [Paraglaciecola sp.]
MQIKVIEVSQICGLAPAVIDVISTTESAIYAAGPSDISAVAIETLAKIHPIHLINTDEQYLVIAGFRLYELCKLILPDAKIPCIVHSDLSDEQLKLFAITDILGSPLVHSLGTKYVQQISSLAKAIDHDNAIRLFPKLKSIRRIRDY